MEPSIVNATASGSVFGPSTELQAQTSKQTDLMDKNDVLLYARSKEGQSYRESLLKGKKVVFVSCGGDITKDNIYLRAKELGIDIYLVEEPGNPLAMKLNEMGLLKSHIQLHLTMRPNIVQDCIDAIDAVFANMNAKPDAVVTFWDDAVGLTSRIASHYHVVTNPVESIDMSHDKYLTRCCLEKAGLPSPHYERAVDYDSMKAAASRMSYPAILKPVQGAASIGVSIVKGPEEALEVYTRTVVLMESVMKDKDLMGLVFDDETKATSTFVLEEFIDGEEVDVDMCLHNGEVVYSNINSDWASENDRFIELGISFPAKCNETQRGMEFRAAALDCCRALGICHGVVHVEMKYSSKYGPTLVELNPRMGGGPLYSFHKSSFDCDLVTEHLLVMCGIPSNPPTFESHAVVCSCLFIYAPRDGICATDMHQSEMADRLRNREHVVSVKYSVSVGDKLNGWDNRDTYPSYVGRVDINVDRSAMCYDSAIDYCVELRAEAAAIEYL